MKRYFLISSIAIAIVLLLSFSVYAFSVVDSSSSNSDRWEYKVLDLKHNNRAASSNEKAINDLGQEGWELMHVTTGGTISGMIDSHLFVFKRKMQ